MYRSKDPKEASNFISEATQLLLALQSTDELSKKYKRIQSALHRAYQDGYDDCILDGGKS